jgi:general secretion pathway protein A
MPTPRFVDNPSNHSGKDTLVMYEAYWGLQRKPFENTADAKFYYPGESHQAALLKLRYVVENGRQGAVLTGSPGLGKSLVIQTLFRMLPSAVKPCVHLVFPQMPPDQLLGYLAFELSGAMSVSPRPSIDESVRLIQQTLRDVARRDCRALVVVDESHLILQNEAFDTLRLLLNFETDGVNPLTLLFVGQPSLLPLLDRHRDLEERLAVKCLLRPLDVDETIAYVHHRVHEAGASRSIFTESALETLHHVAHGVPRQINRLCDLALLIGYAEEQSQIDAGAIEAVANELVTVTPE